jgi:transposase
VGEKGELLEQNVSLELDCLFSELSYKKLERQHFIWPESGQEVMQIEKRQLRWLLEGLDIFKTRAHDSLKYSTVV